MGALGFGRFENYQVGPLLLLLFVDDTVAQVLKFPLVLITAALKGFANTQFIFISAWQGFNFTLLFCGKVRRGFRNPFHYPSSSFDYRVHLFKQRLCQQHASSTWITSRYQSEDSKYDSWIFFFRPYAFPLSFKVFEPQHGQLSLQP